MMQSWVSIVLVVLRLAVEHDASKIAAKLERFNACSRQRTIRGACTGVARCAQDLRIQGKTLCISPVKIWRTALKHTWAASAIIGIRPLKSSRSWYSIFPAAPGGYRLCLSQNGYGILVGNPYKLSFATVTGRGPYPTYNDKLPTFFSPWNFSPKKTSTCAARSRVWIHRKGRRTAPLRLGFFWTNKFPPERLGWLKKTGVIYGIS